LKKKAQFDIEKLEPIKSAPNCYIPALFAHATGDNFIDPSHSKTISDKYGGDCNLINFEGDHISHRPVFFYDSVCIFFNNNLIISSDFGEDNPYVEEQLAEEDFGHLNQQTKSSFMEDLTRATQLSLQEEFVDDDLELALKLSLLESEGTAQTTETGTQSPELKSDTKDKDQKDKEDPKDKNPNDH